MSFIMTTFKLFKNSAHKLLLLLTLFEINIYLLIRLNAIINESVGAFSCNLLVNRKLTISVTLSAIFC